MLYYFIILYHSFHSCFFRLQKYKFLAISENIANYLQNKNSPPHPRLGVPCVAASCACLGVRKAITSVDENKMLSSASSVRCCFHQRPCATPPLPSSVPRHSFRCAPLARLQTSVSGTKASRFRGSLLARGFLGRPRTP